jgi:uncharacterized protein with HEPN domain
LIQDGVLRNLQILAESLKRISQDTKGRSTAIDWRALSGFRNVLVHDYLGINLATVWKIVVVDLPVLKLGIIELRAQLDETLDRKPDQTSRRSEDR